MSPQQLFLILYARKWLVIGVAAFVVGCTVGLSLLLPKKYTAMTSVVVDVKSVDPILGAFMPGQLAPGYMATQIDIITSERVARRVIKLLKLDQAASLREQWRQATDGQSEFESWLVEQLAKRLDVRPSRESSVINIGYVDLDPAQAATFANAFAQAYIDVNLELKVDPARQYANWFDERTKQLRAELESAQKRLSAFQQAQGIVASDERLDVESARLAELSSQLSMIQSLRSDTASRQRQAGQAETLPEVVQNSLIQSLRAELSRLEAERDQLASRYGANHPELKRITAEITAVKERLQVETQRVASSLGTANQVNVSREADIRATLEAQKKRVLELKAQRDQIAVLQRDVESAQRAYEQVNLRLAQSNLESQSRQTNISVLTYAAPPIRHSSPRLLINTILSCFLGGFLGIATALLAELLQRRVRSEEDLIESLGIPVLARLPSGRTRRWLGTFARHAG